MNYLYGRNLGVVSFRWLFPVFILFSGLFVFAGETKSFFVREQTPVHKKDAEVTKDLLIGERLFNGLTSYEAGQVNCAGCHSSVVSDTINWNPSTYDLSAWIAGKTDAEIKSAIETPGSQKMVEAHANIRLSDQEVRQIKAYLEFYYNNGLAPDKPFPIRMILFFFFGILMALAVVDLIFTRKIKHRAIHVLILLTGLAVQTQMAVTEAQNLGRTRHYAPDQPIKFSHKVHAGQNRIDCKYCHTGVFAGKSAGIPSPNLCMNCHFVVKSGRNSGRFEINKIAEALKTGKPIEWIRIHSLPEYAYFNHSQHVMVGSVSCQQCHGPVENMDIIYQYADLSMGWCVNCHRQTKVQADYNPYYQNNKKLQELVKSGKLKSLTVEEIGGLDCMKCHY